MKYTSIAVLLLVGNVSAVKLERDPLLSDPNKNEWAFKTAAAKGPGHPVDYFVPNFGVDKEIKNTDHSITDTEAKLGHFWAIKMKPDAEPPRNYFVPDFGVDNDVKNTLAHAGVAEAKYGHWDVLKKAPADPPRNYAVPNFGMDKEIKNTQQSIVDTEAKLGQWNIKMKPDPEPPRNYAVPNFGVDHDIKVSLQNLDTQEKIHGPMNIEHVQLEEKRDPLLSWSPTWHGKYKINYPVPNFGTDNDILSSNKHTEDAERRLDHDWTPYQEEDDDGNKEWQRIPGVFTLNGRYG